MEKSVINKFSKPLSIFMIALGLYAISKYSYLLFHSLTEVFCVAIALCVFILAWNSRRFLDNNYLLFLGIAYLYIGVLDLIHALSYQGMGVFPAFDANLPTQLWIAGRYVQSLSLLIAPFFLEKKLRVHYICLGYTIITFALLATIFLGYFPDCFVEGVGLTPLKISSEYIISLILLASIFVLYRKREQFDQYIVRWLVTAIALTIAAELAFTLYTGVYDFYNLIGHLFKVFSFYLIYRAIIEKGVTKPFDFLFRNLKRKEARLIEHQARLEDQVRERTVELTELNQQLEKEVRERKHIEETLLQRNIELESLNRINRVFISTLEHEQAMIAALGLLRELLGASSCSTWLVEPATNELVCQHINSTVREFSLGWWSTIGSGIVNRVFDSRKNLLVSDMSENTEFPDIVAESAGLGSIIAVPLQTKDKIVGVLAAISIETGLFDSTNTSVFEVTATAIANTAERFQLLENVSAHAQQIQNILNTIPEGVFLLDLDMVIQVSNPLARQYLEKITPFEPDKPLIKLGGRPIEEFLFSPSYKGIWQQINLDDQIFRVLSQPITEEMHNLGWVVIIWDATKEYHIQNRMQQQDRLAAVGQLAAGIAHDFNNIMSIIVLYAQMAIDAPDLPPDTRENLKILYNQAMNATKLIRQILDFSKSATLEKIPLNLLGFIQDQVKILERTFPENIKIKLTHGYDNYNISVDSTRIQQVFMNLALNARDAMSDGGVLNIELEQIWIKNSRDAPIPGMAEGSWIQLVMSDTGEGIPLELQANIFEPFFTTKDRGQGTGLGLAQVYGIVKNHGGEIQVDSQVGRGTMFTIYLPSVPLQYSELTRPEDESIPLGKGERILLVEDDIDTRKAIEKTLEILNYEVVEANNGREALEIFQRFGNEIDLVLTDLVMPEMGGKLLAQALLDINPQVNLIVLTGHPILDDGESLKAAGITTWIQKPPRIVQLAQVIAQFLEN
ncbi:MAG: response regulator [Anaerolineales bacterium]|nr:response regulator [Anaerolineales bacterium]